MHDSVILHFISFLIVTAFLLCLERKVLNRQKTNSEKSTEETGFHDFA